MRTLTIIHPHRLVFGPDSLHQFVSDFIATGLRRLLVVTAPAVLPLIEPRLEELKRNRVDTFVDATTTAEPAVSSFLTILERARGFQADSVLGVGGGSVLDVAKLVAGLNESSQSIHDVFGIGNLRGRRTYLICIPTTSGTGSEVSPNAILLDAGEGIKKAVISPHLIPDAAYVDPKLTLTLPPRVTAETGMDALTHCIEVYANKRAHPLTDLYALEGIRLIGKYLKRAVIDGHDLQARTYLALASMYGGIGLGPVNTAAVHALSYPLNGFFRIPHGLSNALLLPHVVEFNLDAAPERYAAIAMALGAEQKVSTFETAAEAVRLLKQLSQDIGLPTRLRELNIAEESLDRIASMGMEVTRLLQNNVKELRLDDARNIVRAAF